MATYNFISKVTPTTGSFSFTSIPSTYTDLVLLISARSAATGWLQTFEARFNSTVTTASDTKLQGTATTVSSGRDTSGNTIYFGTYNGASSTANTYSNIEVYIPNYNSSDSKIASVTSITEALSSTANQTMTEVRANLSAVTAPITSIFITDSGTQNIASGSEFILYGIKNS